MVCTGFEHGARAIVVIVENLAGDVPDPNNRPPILTIAPLTAVTLPDVLSLVASATDDGLPKPYRRSVSNPNLDAQPRRPLGVDIKWTNIEVPDPCVCSRRQPRRLRGTGRADVEGHL